jgi:hypothetical protein
MVSAVVDIKDLYALAPDKVRATRADVMEKYGALPRARTAKGKISISQNSRNAKYRRDMGLKIKPRRERSDRGLTNHEFQDSAK